MGMYLSVEVSIILTLMAAAIWGSWTQITKHLDGYPISGTIFLMYGFSFTFIWGVTLIVSPHLLEMGILETTLENRTTVLRVLYGGELIPLGLYPSPTTINEVGLLLLTTISGGVGIVLGLLASISEEGLPDRRYGLLLIVLITMALLVTDLICNLAAEKRDQELYHARKREGVVTDRVLILMLLTTIFINGWGMGTAVGTVRGFAPVSTCAYMVAGSFLSVGVLLDIKFMIKREQKKTLYIGTRKEPILLSAIVAICHYDGNPTFTYSMPAISATLSFLFGEPANAWTIFWGIYYKGFTGVSGEMKRLLWTGTLLYFMGIGFLGIYQLA